LNENSPSIDGDLPFVYEADYVAVARVLLAQGRLDPAVDLLTRLQDVAEVGGRYLRVIELLLLLAIADQANGDLPQALTRLEQALNLGESRGMIRTFVTEGPDVARLLYAAVKQKIMPEYVQRIIAALPIERPLSPSALPSLDGSASSDDGWVEPLTERETEILHLISEGLTNKEIGSRLYISGNTTKVHLRNIYGKLGVKNRTQAVAKGRTLGILMDR
jgi:LuxR family maltose regulon positive regulatory protein